MTQARPHTWTRPGSRPDKPAGTPTPERTAVSHMTPFLRAWAATLAQRWNNARRDDRGTVVETAVIYAGAAALALSAMFTIKMLVDGKLADITL